jgi:hypothetical protein
MTTWQDDIQGCFGSEDKRFGIHPLDEERALKLAKRMRDESITWAEAEKEILRYLNGCTAEHIERELKTAKRLLNFSEPLK